MQYYANSLNLLGKHQQFQLEWIQNESFIFRNFMMISNFQSLAIKYLNKYFVLISAAATHRYL